MTQGYPRRWQVSARLIYYSSPIKIFSNTLENEWLMAGTPKNREANAGSEAAAFALFSYRVFGASSTQRQNEWFVLRKVWIPTGSSSSSISDGSKKNDTSSSRPPKLLVPRFLQPRTEGRRTRCRDRRYEDSPLQTNDQGIFLKKQENPPTKKVPSFQGNRYSNNDMIQQPVRRNSSLQVAQNLWKVRKTVRLWYGYVEIQHLASRRSCAWPQLLRDSPIAEIGGHSAW